MMYKLKLFSIRQYFLDHMFTDITFSSKKNICIQTHLCCIELRTDGSGIKKKSRLAQQNNYLKNQPRYLPHHILFLLSFAIRFK